jgi:hypothetical protein
MFLNTYRVYAVKTGGNKPNFAVTESMGCDELWDGPGGPFSFLRRCGEVLPFTVPNSSQTLKYGTNYPGGSAIGHYKKVLYLFEATYVPTAASSYAQGVSPRTNKCVDPPTTAARCPWP